MSNFVRSIVQPLGLEQLIPLLVLYETEIAVKVWDGSLNSDERFIHETLAEFRQVLSQINIPNKDGYIEREFILSNYMKYYDKLPFDIAELTPLDNGKASVRYRIKYENMCSRPGDEPKISVSDRSSPRLKGW